MQGADAGQAVRALGVAAQCRHDAMGKAPAHATEQVGVVAQADRHRALEGQHPLAEGDGRQTMVDHQGGALGRATAEARPVQHLADPVQVRGDPELPGFVLRMRDIWA